ncbi:unnamed protein product [Ectocarpus sp. 8 AP-2014]
MMLRKPCRIAVATVALLTPEAGAFYTMPPPITTTNRVTSMLSRPSAATRQRHPISSTCRRRSLAPLRMAASSNAAAAAGGNDDLRGKVAVVTGSSRGIGKGIAVTLGQRGCTVYVTGRSVGGNTTDKARGSLEETAAEIEAAGGKGIPVACDHAKDEQVKALFERVESEQGRLDILVNNAFALGPGDQLQAKFWTQGADAWDSLITVGLRSHYMASCFAAPLMIKSVKDRGGKPGLIACVSSFGGLTYS